MTDNDNLAPEIISALRRVPVADDELRERHIATALAAVESAPAHRSRRSWISSAAALVILASGVSIARNNNSTRLSGVSAAEHSPTTLPAKSVTSGADTTVAQIDCQAPTSTAKFVGEYEFSDTTRTVYVDDTSFIVVDETCRSLVTFSAQPGPASKTVCIPSLAVGGQMIGTAQLQSTDVVVLADASDITVIGGAQCGVLARQPQPADR